MDERASGSSPLSCDAGLSQLHIDAADDELGALVGLDHIPSMDPTAPMVLVTGLPPRTTGQAAREYANAMKRVEAILQWCAQSPHRLAHAATLLEDFRGMVLCVGCGKKVKSQDAHVRYSSPGQVKTCVGCAKVARRWKFHPTTPVRTKADLDRLSPSATKERLRRLMQLYEWEEVGQGSREQRHQEAKEAPATASPEPFHLHDRRSTAGIVGNGAVAGAGGGQSPPARTEEGSEAAAAGVHAEVRSAKRARKKMGIAPNKGAHITATTSRTVGAIEAWLHPRRPGLPCVPLSMSPQLSDLRGASATTQVPAGVYELHMRVHVTPYRETSCYVGAGSLALDSAESGLRYKDLPIVAGGPIADRPRYPGCWEFTAQRGGERTARFGVVVVRPGAPHVLALLAVRARQVECLDHVRRLRQYAMVVGVAPLNVAPGTSPTTVAAPPSREHQLHADGATGPCSSSEGSEVDGDVAMSASDADSSSSDDDSDDELSGDGARQYVR